MGLLFREHPKAQPEGGFRRSPGSNLRPNTSVVVLIVLCFKRIFVLFEPYVHFHILIKFG